MNLHQALLGPLIHYITLTYLTITLHYPTKWRDEPSINPTNITEDEREQHNLPLTSYDLADLPGVTSSSCTRSQGQAGHGGTLISVTCGTWGQPAHLWPPEGKTNTINVSWLPTLAGDCRTAHIKSRDSKSSSGLLLMLEDLQEKDE